MSRPSRCRGRGLVEFVAATMVALLLLAAAGTLYLHNEHRGRALPAPVRAEAALRAAFAVLERELRMAGAWGLGARADFITGAAGVAEAPGAVDAAVLRDCGRNFVADLARPVEARPHYDLGCAGTRPVPWSDVLIVRRAAVAPSAPQAGRVQIDSTRLGGVLTVDGAPPTAGDQGERHDLLVDAYYVGEDPGAGGTRHWSLRRQALGRTGAGRPAMFDQSVVAGIADLRLTLGVDTDGDGAVDVYVRPGEPELARGRVVSVRVTLTALGEEAGDAAQPVRDGPPPDGRARHVLERTVTLRNGGGR